MEGGLIATRLMLGVLVLLWVSVIVWVNLSAPIQNARRRRRGPQRLEDVIAVTITNSLKNEPERWAEGVFEMRFAIRNDLLNAEVHCFASPRPRVEGQVLDVTDPFRTDLMAARDAWRETKKALATAAIARKFADRLIGHD